MEYVMAYMELSFGNEIITGMNIIYDVKITENVMQYKNS